MWHRWYYKNEKLVLIQAIQGVGKSLFMRPTFQARYFNCTHDRNQSVHPIETLFPSNVF